MWQGMCHTVLGRIRKLCLVSLDLVVFIRLNPKNADEGVSEADLVILQWCGQNRGTFVRHDKAQGLYESKGRSGTTTGEGNPGMERDGPCRG
jgi:hypothetical protein